MVDVLPHPEYIKIIDKSNAKTILIPYVLLMKGNNKLSMILFLLFCRPLCRGILGDVTSCLMPSMM